MLASIKGYYDGEQIIIDEVDKKQMMIGQEVIITLLDYPSKHGMLEDLEMDKFVIPTERGEHVDEYIKEIRENDRF